MFCFCVAAKVVDVILGLVLLMSVGSIGSPGVQDGCPGQSTEGGVVMGGSQVFEGWSGYGGWSNQGGYGMVNPKNHCG
jgi:hypothetical protein